MQFPSSAICSICSIFKIHHLKKTSHAQVPLLFAQPRNQLYIRMIFLELFHNVNEEEIALNYINRQLVQLMKIHFRLDFFKNVNFQF